MAGPVDIDPAKPHAFLSYTRFDDNFLNGGISALREALELAVQARTGKKFNIFQDVDDIKPGDAWRKKLDRAIEAAQLFIPILTPSFFESDFCRGEAKAFLAYEARARRDDLVLPIYIIDTPKLDDDDQRAADELANSLHERQYDDWRPLRFKLQHDDTRPRVDELAGVIAAAIAKYVETEPPPPPPPEPPPPTEELVERLASLEAELQEERSKSAALESALADERNKTRKLAEAYSTVEGQVEAAKKTEVALRREIASPKQLLDEAEAALKAAQANDKQITRDASGIPRPFYLGAATLALFLGALGWIVGRELAASGSPAYTPLSTFRDCGDCPEMVKIPAGSFEMVSPKGEGGDDKHKLRKVTFAKPFAIGKYEVTFDEWKACAAAKVCEPKEPKDEGWGRGSRPVINVNWNDAKKYTEWLSGETKETYRLPSEAEWEYAARAAPPSTWRKLIDYLFGALTKEQPYGGRIGGTREVGVYSNDWGLYDMLGNVWEWVEDTYNKERYNDRYDEDYKKAVEFGGAWVEETNSEGEVTDSKGKENEPKRVIRGASWNSNQGGLRPAYRDGHDWKDRTKIIGFRVARDIKE